MNQRNNNTNYGYPENPSIAKINQKINRQPSQPPRSTSTQIFGVGDSEKSKQPAGCTVNNSGGHSLPCFMRQMR
jgi:hypothetical protein